jgi:hypothetical protein
VSVENDKLGDMYFYIARGIELLAEGDRLNTKVDRTDPEPDDRRKRRIGSPDIRKEIGFFYQNKFGVSDKVQTLRCLMQLSCVRPADRKPDSFLIPGKGVDPEQFQKFCAQNPQLVRRLQAKLNCKHPEQVIDFLRDNEGIPTLYKNDTELADAADQFPVLPPRFPEGEGEEGVREYMVGETGTHSREMDDTFDAFLAGRSWFTYALTVVPPPKTDEFGDPIPWSSPRPGEYNQFRYRMPRSPAIIIFRNYPARAQTYLAERLTKEGWFDESTTWSPDDQSSLSSESWFPRFARDGTPLNVRLATPASSRVEWDRAWNLWNRYGQQNGMILSPAKRLQLETRAGGTAAGLPPDMTDEEARVRGLDPRRLDAQRALVYYEQNRSVTNFPYFLESTLAERDPTTVEARKLLWEAEQAESGALWHVRGPRLYTQALAKWREVLVKFPRFHRSERSETTEEATYEYELKLIGLLKQDGGVLEKAGKVAAASLGLFPSMPEAQVRDDYIQAVAEDEANARVAAYLLLNTYPKQQWVPESPERKALDRINEAVDRTICPHPYPAAALAGDAAVEVVTQRMRADVREATVRQLLDSKEFGWMKEFKQKPTERDADGNYEREAYWVSPALRDSVKTRLGLVRKAPPPPEAMPDGGPGSGVGGS